MANVFGRGMRMDDFNERVMSNIVGHNKVSTIKEIRKEFQPHLMLSPFMALDKFSVPAVEEYVRDMYEFHYNYAHQLFRGQFEFETDLCGRKAIVNLLGRPLLLVLQKRASEQEADTGMTPAGDSYNIPSHNPNEDNCFWDFPELNIFQEENVRFNFDGPDWQIAAEAGEGNSIGEQAPKTGTEPMLIPYDNAHVSLTLKGPAPLVSLLNLQSQVNFDKEFHIISVNARFLLFNETPFPLRAIAFAVRLSDGDNPIATLPTPVPVSSPAVQAATVVTKPSKGEVKEEAAAARNEPTPYPLELWHLLGTGDSKIVPYLALSSPDSEEHGCPLRLDLSQNNSTITVPVKTEGEVANVSLIIQLKDRENGQQTLIIVKEESDLVQNESDVPSSGDFDLDFPDIKKALAHVALLHELRHSVDPAQTERCAEFRANDEDAQSSNGTDIQLDGSINEHDNKSDHNEDKADENQTEQLTGVVNCRSSMSNENLADDLKSRLSVSEQST